MKKKLFFTILALVCAITCAFGLAACDNGNDAQKVAVTGVTLNKTELALEVGGEETLTATVTPDNATDKTVTWTADKPETASVDGNGKVTAKTAGTAVITAKAGGKSATCTVTVREAINYTVTRAEWESALSETKFINYTATITYTGLDRNLMFKADLENNKYFYNDDGGDDVFYTKEADEKYYEYIKEAGALEYIKTEGDEKHYYGHYFESIEIIVFADSYSDFVFNTDTNSYIYADTDLTVAIKFENGRLVYWEVRNEETVQTVTYSDFGTTTVDLSVVTEQVIKI